MAYTRNKSIVLKNGGSERVYRTFEDWQREQSLDERTPAERGLQIGSPVMWRHMRNKVIVTDRAIVLSIAADTLTVRVKDVSEHTCDIHVREVVNNRADDRATPSQYDSSTNRKSYLTNQLETEAPPQSVEL